VRPDQSCAYANDTFRRYLGGLELVGKRRAEVLPDEAAFSHLLDRVQTLDRSFHARELPVRVDLAGRGAWTYELFDAYVLPMHDGSGAVTGCIAIAVEVSESVETRRKLERAVVDLERRVRECDDLLAAASHDLRTPLSTLTLHLGSLRKRVEARELVELAPSLDAMTRSVQRLTDLVDGVLDVGRGDRSAREKVDVDLVVVARDVAARSADLAARVGCDIEVRAEGPVIGRWDPLELARIVENLLSNALKYGQGRPVELGVASSDERAILAVRDHGIGIADADRARIFQRFERLDDGRAQAGFGLGLWIVKQLVDGMGGAIAVASEPGRGTTFTVELPRRPSPR
jgi:signal transduction histidine kinase